jgi:serine/threonine protein kinase
MISVADRENVADRELLLGRLLDEYLTALERGSPLDLEELTNNHPSLEDEIRQFAASLDFLHRATRPLQGAAADSAPSIAGPKRLGEFLIGAEIGRGGMGVVYEAVQAQLDRKVALKVLPFAAAWDQKQIARFRNEALAAAQLHHPNIVPVFAVGEDRGVHYYAMQHVAGRSLDLVILDLRGEGGRQPSPGSTVALGRDPTDSLMGVAPASPDRIRTPNLAHCRTVTEWGIQAAHALHHAHEYGIIHRDIKPSNLILDQDGKAWVTDFGLARVQNGTGVTMTGDIVGTLRYMSPEQAAGRHAEVDGRTDIYALGATLYELLTLQPPFPGDDQHEIRQAIESSDPVPLRSLNPAIPADLETVVLHALAKNREDRYPTAEALADDLRRFLDGQPTLARPPSLLDRGVKWVWRHRRLAAAAVVAMAVLTTISTIGVAWLAREIAAKQDALKREQASLRQAREVVDRFGIELADALQLYPGTESLQHLLREETLGYYLGFIQQAADDPSLSDQLADAHLRVAQVSAKLGDNDRAAAGYQAALAILDRLVVSHPGDSSLGVERAVARNALALVHAAAGAPERGVQECDLAIRELDALPTLPRDGVAVAQARINRGTLLTQLGRHDDATRSLQEAITTLQDLPTSSPVRGDVTHALGLAYNSLNVAHRSAGRQADALQAAERAGELLALACADEQATDEWRADLALARGNLATLQGERGDTAAAIDSLHQAIALRESLFRRAPGVVRHRTEMGISLSNVAMLHLRKRDVSAAKTAFEYAGRVFAGIVTDYPEQASYRIGWAAFLNNQGFALAEAGHYEDAASAFTLAIDHQRRAITQLPDSSRSKARTALNTIYVNQGKALRGWGSWPEAIASTMSRWQDCGGKRESLDGVVDDLFAVHESGDESSRQRVRFHVIATLLDVLHATAEPLGSLMSEARLASIVAWPEALLLGNQKVAGVKRYDLGCPKPPASCLIGEVHR